jgi:hypothetical protein
MVGKQGSLDVSDIVTWHTNYPTSDNNVRSNSKLIFNEWQTCTNIITPFGLPFTLVHFKDHFFKDLADILRISFKLLMKRDTCLTKIALNYLYLRDYKVSQHKRQ